MHRKLDKKIYFQKLSWLLLIHIKFSECRDCQVNGCWWFFHVFLSSIPFLGLHNWEILRVFYIFFWFIRGRFVCSNFHPDWLFVKYKGVSWTVWVSGSQKVSFWRWILVKPLVYPQIFLILFIGFLLRFFRRMCRIYF